MPRLPTTLFISVFMFTLQAEAQTIEPVSLQDYVLRHGGYFGSSLSLGQGCHVDKIVTDPKNAYVEQPISVAYLSTADEEPTNEKTTYVVQGFVETQSQLDRLRGLNVAVEASAGFVTSAHAKIEVDSVQELHSLHHSVIYQCTAWQYRGRRSLHSNRLQDAKQRLSNIAIQYLDKTKQFEEQFGDHYVSELLYGAGIQVLFRMQTDENASQESLRSLANLSISSIGYSGQGGVQLTDQLKTFLRKVDVQAQIYVIGGGKPTTGSTLTTHPADKPAILDLRPENLNVLFDLLSSEWEKARATPAVVGYRLLPNSSLALPGNQIPAAEFTQEGIRAQQIEELWDLLLKMNGRLRELERYRSINSLSDDDIKFIMILERVYTAERDRIISIGQEWLAADKSKLANLINDPSHKADFTPSISENRVVPDDLKNLSDFRELHRISHFNRIRTYHPLDLRVWLTDVTVAKVNEERDTYMEYRVYVSVDGVDQGSRTYVIPHPFTDLKESVSLRPIDVHGSPNWQGLTLRVSVFASHGNSRNEFVVYSHTLSEADLCKGLDNRGGDLYLESTVKAKCVDGYAYGTGGTITYRVSGMP